MITEADIEQWKAETAQQEKRQAEIRARRPWLFGVLWPIGSAIGSIVVAVLTILGRLRCLRGRHLWMRIETGKRRPVVGCGECGQAWTLFSGGFWVRLEALDLVETDLEDLAP